MRRKDPMRAILIAGGAVFGLIAVMVLVGAAVVAAIAAKVPPLSQLHPIVGGGPSIVYYADGTQAGLIPSSVLRTPIAYSQMPTYLTEATVAIEDQRFYQTGAIDPLSIVRAALTDLTSGKALQGGSTITMQLVRNLYLSDDKTFSFKIKEAVIAERLEHAHSKEWILKTYLNTVPYGTVEGQTAEGVDAASWVFFDHPARYDSLAQSALLAGLPQAPTDYNPLLYPGAARARRNTVLAKMAQLGYISAGAAAAAERSPLGLHPNDHYQLGGSYLLNFIKHEVVAHYGAGVLASGGLRIYTTIDPHLSGLARGAITGVLNLPTDPSAAVVSENPANGYVTAMAQSGTYAQSEYNLATDAQRQPGSTFKAIVLADALSRGIDPFTTIYLSHTLPDGWLPSAPTYSVSIDGGANLDEELNLDQALVASDNTVFAQLAADLGEDTITKMAYAMGARDAPRQLPGRGARRAHLRRHAARDGERLLDDRRRRLPQQADHDPQGRLPGRARRRELGRAAARAGALAPGGAGRDLRSSRTTSSTAPPRTRRSPARARRRPARRAAWSTPGSTASPPTSRRSCGWGMRSRTSR